MTEAQVKSARPGVSADAPEILLVDDDEDVLMLLSRWLEGAGYRVSTSTTGRDALARLSITIPNLVVTDFVMEGMDGIQLLKEIHNQNPVLPVIMLSGQAEIPDAVRATSLGATAFLVKPIEKDDLLAEIRTVLKREGVSSRRTAKVFGDGILYRSSIMAELLSTAQRVAVADSAVFISGATGSGKEMLAKAIHDASARAGKPFIGVNCGAIPEQLLESELFGHEKGAFTGATGRHEGLFQAANGGTLFLDEVGDMPLPLQVKLLRVLQDFQVRPVGSTQSIPIDVRIISATHQNLEESVEKGEFREDLYYRLNVLPLHMPPLSSRREDIPLLIDAFLEEQARRNKGRRQRFAPEAMEYLVSAGWPGNVRQLRNVVEQCTALSSGDVIPLSQAKIALRDQPVGIQTLDEAKMAFERNYLISVLRIANGNVASATRIAGRNRTDFYKLLNRHNIDPAIFRLRRRAGTEDGE